MAAKAAPSKTANNGVNEEDRIQRGLNKLKEAFTDNLNNFQPLLAKCKEGVQRTSNSAKIQPHQNIICDYITSAVRGTYGNNAPKNKAGSGSGAGPSPGPAPVPGAGPGPVWSGLKHTYRCSILRICMKYLMYHYCVKENDITTILTAMEERVSKWTAGGDGKPDEKKKNRRYFDKCIKKSWKEEKSKENRLRCRVIKIIQQIETNTSGKWSQLKTLPGAGSGTCSTAPNNQHINQYVSECSLQPNGTAVGGAASAGVGSVVDDDDADDDSEDEEEDDEIFVVGAPATTTASSTQPPSLPGGNGNGKGGKGIFPSLSSFPFDSINPYLPLVPSILGIITITYFLWKVI